MTQRQESALGVLSRSPLVWRPPAYSTSDWQAARRSVESLATLRPQVPATGHGLPLTGEPMRRQLDALVRDWDRVVPAHGRHVRSPDITDERGVVSVPPPVADPRLFAVAGRGLAAVVGALLLGGSPAGSEGR